MDKIINYKIKVKLNEKQKKILCRIFKRIKLNATKSYMEIYLDSSYIAARSNASDLLSNPNVK